jgi:hypothetical protein
MRAWEERAAQKMFNALSVIMTDDRIREFLVANDPKALAQVEAARFAAIDAGVARPLAAVFEPSPEEYRRDR